MTAPEKPKLGWLDRRRAKREEDKRRKAERAYRNLGRKGGVGSELSGGNPNAKLPGPPSA
jgi:hypothetical protein